jgi:hypothetical protein
MVRFDSNEQLVQALSADLTPVDRLAPPSLRVLLWLAMVGAVAPWSIADAYPMPPDGTEHCLIFILGLSLPLSLLLIVMLRQGFSLQPNLTAIIGGLACASAAATLLNLIHPYDAAATDLTVHAFAVAIVIVANTIYGGRLLMRKMHSPAGSNFQRF